MKPLFLVASNASPEAGRAVRADGPDRCVLPFAARGLFGRIGPERPAPRPPARTTTIETLRLVLRPWRMDDFPAFAALMAEPGTFRFSERGPMSREEAWARFLRHSGHWTQLGYGLFAVIEKKSGRLVGETGLADFRRELGTAFDPFPEATWTIAPSAQGRGYAGEAAKAAHDWTTRMLGARRTVCIIHAANAASARVAAKLGYAAYDEADYRGYPAIFFARHAGERP